jgi:hypothetical protein
VTLLFANNLGPFESVFPNSAFTGWIGKP